MLLNKVFLFDLDGVLIDTESQYDLFWREIAQKYKIEIPHFEYLIKGSTLNNIINKYFSHLSLREQREIADSNQDFNLKMAIKPIPGALEFLEELKRNNIKTALVTSSDDKKLEYVFSILPLQPYFNTIVSADRITRGKPDPMCYLLAAQDLNELPINCLVFEDSFNGLEAGNNAGMTVVGLSTSNSADSIRKYAVKIIPDFKEVIFTDFL